ncbi:alcohol dehydrogenase catalytic domain-containing protein [Wenzhouxiangella marina]|nr:alcohol dehydrogenase catalytic domain-containing protein [Wenzhouxiangella marina]MBB6086639.1 propanol-preferring alcohol dehydrogenase [Wenzhouxiangella marina]
MQLQSIGPIRPDSEPLVEVEVLAPSPASGELKLRIEACAVCHTELDQIEGRVPTTLPRIPGHQVIGTVIECGRDVPARRLGQRVGVGWIASACGHCRWCERGEENLCPEFQGTGCDRDGGYAEFMTIPAAFAVPIPKSLDPIHAAPMLCAGAIGFRSLKLADLVNGQVLGLTGFGASNHLVLSLARALLPDTPVFVFARDPDQRRQAIELGAHWAGDTHEQPPAAPDAIIDTTPVWETVLAALTRLAPGGRLVINAIAKEPGDRQRLVELDYPSQLWKEKEIKSVANVTRADIEAFLAAAAEHGFRPEVSELPLEQANDALKRIRFGRFRGAFVLQPGEHASSHEPLA